MYQAFAWVLLGTAFSVGSAAADDQTDRKIAGVADVSFLQYDMEIREASNSRQEVVSDVEAHTSAPEGSGQRLHIISITGTSNENLSIICQESWAQRLGRKDNYTNVCDDDCGEVIFQGQRLTHVLPLRDSAFPSGRCIASDGMNCSGWLRAQFKFVWGFVHEYRRLAAEGAPMPKWWFIKDDDTYVNIDRLMALAEQYNPDDRVFVSGFTAGKLWQQNEPGPIVMGGGGWLASAAMAEELVHQHGNEWLEWQETLLLQSHKGQITGWKDFIGYFNPAYDVNLMHMIRMVPNAKIVDASDDMLSGFGWRLDASDDMLSDTSACPGPYATVHLSEGWKGMADPLEMVKLAADCVND